VTSIDAALAAVEAAKAEAERNRRLETLLAEINDKLARKICKDLGIPFIR